MQFFATLLSALALAASASATPIAARNELIVVSPQVTSPTTGTIWTTGSSQTVTWDTSKIPPSGSNNTGLILLGYDDGSSSENLDINNPLASGFPITAGSQNITVPNVDTKTTYFVVLFGDSGNKSPEFTITKKLVPINL
ncbi:hypothetical protein BC834DRAFT_841658 [Gloeopeniophorella convolvens]|nr:hypothetical protein BC834DRAFT_841658 [Gloeopeniophorella convolvens]